MVRDAQEGSGAQELAALVGRLAAVAAVVAALLVALGLVAELLRRRRRGQRVVAVIDRVLPFAVRTAVVAIVTVVGTSTAVRPAGGADTVRGWLRGGVANTTPTTTPTSTTSPSAPSTTTTSTTPPVLVPPLVLEPPVTFEDLEPPSTAPVRPAPPPPSPATAPRAPVVRSAPPATVYVVAPGDCLWSIAARLLGPGAGDPSIDAGWRRIYAANRAAIGEDPNLIHVGLALQLPPLDPQP